VDFYYIDLPRWLWPLRSFQGGIQLYAYLWQARAYFAARRLHQRINFHAFHHITYANDWMASFIGALLPVPFLRGPGGGAHRTPQGLLCEYSLRGRFAERLRDIGQWVFRHDPFFRLGQGRARAILVCNREAMEGVALQWRHKVRLFPLNGVSSEDLRLTASGNEFHRSMMGTEPAGYGAGKQRATFLVLSAGKLLPIKGFSLALQAFRAFVERCAEAQFTLIGSGTELPRLKSLARQLGLETRVRFHPWMTRQELLREMLSCDVFLFPSFRDGGGAVVVEAMAAGRPVICLDIGGPGMHVTNNCGIKIRPRSSDQVVREMAAALERLYKDKELRSRMGRAARERAEQVYHWDRLGERMMDIYAEVIRDETKY